MITDILSNAGDFALSAAIQFIIGILLSVPVYKLIAGRRASPNNHFILTGLVCAILGIVLPLGPFGVLPVTIAALCAGTSIVAIIPLAASNFIFNMLMPFTELSFNWDLACLRVLSAFAVGIISLFIFRIIFKGNNSTIRKNIMEKFQVHYEKTNLVGLFSAMINEIGLFLIIGVLLNAVRNYYFSDVLGTFLNSEGGLVVRNFLLDRNASTSPFFITSATIFNTVTDLTIPAALLSFLKLRGAILLYVATGCVCALLVSIILL